MERLTGHSSLHDASGHQYRTVQEFERGAETGAVLKELEAQYRLASKAGIRISHVDNHMGACTGWKRGEASFRRCCGRLRVGASPRDYSAISTRRIRAQLAEYRASGRARFRPC